MNYTKTIRAFINSNILGNKPKYNVKIQMTSRDSERNGADFNLLKKVARVDHPETRIGKLTVGKALSIRDTVQLDMVGDIEIGDYVIFSDYVNVMTHDHNVKGKEVIMVADNKKGVNWSSLKIGADAYFGLRSVVTKNVTNIPKGFVLGANAVLTKNPKKEYEIWAGVPAKKIGERR
jgi:acetyltransferase-like isoleucine patch superfamily enzyme